MSQKTFDRRTFLKGAALGLSVPLIAGCDDESTADDMPDDDVVDAPDAGEPDLGEVADAEPPAPHPADAEIDDVMYPRAILAGAMTSTGALIRGFRDPDAEGSPRLLVWPEDDDGPGETVIDRVVSPEEGHLNLELDTLEPGTRYAFAFFEGEGLEPEALTRSPEGRFRTAPAPGESPALTLAASACTALRFAPWPGLDISAEARPDVFCHLGDMVYNDGAESLEEFRAGWQATLETPEYRALFAEAGGYFTWDDHELTDNSALYTLPPEVRARGVQAFFEALPIRSRGIEGIEAEQFWMSHRWGLTAEIFILDCRGERRPETAGTPEAQYISPEQMRWLKEALEASPCRFKVILNSVPITTYAERYPAADDRWQGYAAQRDELLDFITGEDGGAGVEGVWFLSGDFHLGVVSAVDAEGPRAGIREILAGPGGSITNPLGLLPERNPELAAEFFPPEQFEYVSAAKASTVLTFDPEAGTVRVHFVEGETGETLFDVTYDA
ncbi:MAG: alkaline phosphatase D family protein [Bradymonadia bacterium]